jgi:hypothetical protein
LLTLLECVQNTQPHRIAQNFETRRNQIHCCWGENFVACHDFLKTFLKNITIKEYSYAVVIIAKQFPGAIGKISGGRTCKWEKVPTQVGKIEAKRLAVPAGSQYYQLKLYGMELASFIVRKEPHVLLTI